LDAAERGYAGLLVSLTQLLYDNPVLPLRRDLKALDGLSDCFVRIGSLYSAQVLSALADDVYAPTCH
jgi:hypothetical protein